MGYSHITLPPACAVDLSVGVETIFAIPVGVGALDDPQNATTLKRDKPTDADTVIFCAVGGVRGLPSQRFFRFTSDTNQPFHIRRSRIFHNLRFAQIISRAEGVFHI